MLNVLENNWEKIKKQVVMPLWNGKFKSMYEANKMDYDDFESLAAIEMTKAMKTFDPKKANIFTYSKAIINKKAMTELRDCTKRDVRRALYVSDSVDAMDKTIVENIPSPDNREEYTELSELRVGNFVNSLNNDQLRVLILNLLNFENDDIPHMLNISNKTTVKIINSLKDTGLTRVLYRRKF